MSSGWLSAVLWQRPEASPPLFISRLFDLPAV